MAAGFIDKGPRSMAARIGSQTLAWLISINLGVSLLIWISALLSGGKIELEMLLGLSGSWKGFCIQPWGLLTYMVTQAGVLHLFFNLIWLYFFGKISLMIMNDRQLLFLYIGGGIVGGLAFIFRSLYLPVGYPLLGSSAAVMAMMGAAAVYQPRYPINLMLFGRVPLYVIALISVALTFLGGGGGNIGGQAAHLGGLLFGVWAGWMMRSHKDPSRIFSGIGAKTSRWRAERRANTAARRRRADESLLTGIRGRLADRERLDELLDKIRASGYSSLTRSERAELNALSNRLETPRGYEDRDL